jgi:hypothetical protein
VVGFFKGRNIAILRRMILRFRNAERLISERSKLLQLSCEKLEAHAARFASGARAFEIQLFRETGVTTAGQPACAIEARCMASVRRLR